MTSDLAIPSGPVADRLTLWPVDDGRYGVDASFQGASGYERCETHREALVELGVPHKHLQNMDGSWSLRFGPMTAHEAGGAVSAFLS